MSVYKVPQDVEADDKLIGPFSFRQFVYLLIVAGMIMLGWALFQIFPGLALIPVPVILFFGALALPIRRDQPMETYLAAIASFYLKPRKRLWEADGQDRILEIVAPEVTELELKRLPGDEVQKRLTYLSAVVDSGGRIIRDSRAAAQPALAPASANPALGPPAQTLPNAQVMQIPGVAVTPEQADAMRQIQASAGLPTVDPATLAAVETTNFNPFPAEAENYTLPPEQAIEEVPPESDVLDENAPQAQRVAQKIQTEEKEQLRETIQTMQNNAAVVSNSGANKPKTEVKNPASTKPPDPAIIELAHNNNISIATMAKEADRLDRDSDGEIMVSLR